MGITSVSLVSYRDEGARDTYCVIRVSQDDVHCHDVKYQGKMVILIVL